MAQLEKRLFVVLVIFVMLEAKLASSKCTQVGPCRCRNKRGIIDLRRIPRRPCFSDVPDSLGSWMFSYSPCRPFTEGSQECTNVSVCQVASDYSNSYPAGTVESARFGQGSDGHPIITYSSTDTSGTTRTTIVTLQCNRSADPGNLQVYGEDPTNPSHYDMTLTSKYACFTRREGTTLDKSLKVTEQADHEKRPANGPK